VFPSRPALARIAINRKTPFFLPAGVWFMVWTRTGGADKAYLDTRPGRAAVGPVVAGAAIARKVGADERKSAIDYLARQIDCQLMDG
jgi:hypothetical protein